MRDGFARVVRLLASAVVAALFVAAPLAHAEASVVRISYGFGILYLPLMVMDRERLIEKHAEPRACRT